MKQRLEASVKSEGELQEQVTAQQKQVEDANQHCEALQKAREDAEDELQVSHDAVVALPVQSLSSVRIQSAAMLSFWHGPMQT